MGTRDPRVDAYIAKSTDFARPILSELREMVHEACPDVEEAIKWGFPNFMYKGILCNMASFKAHCAFGFWKEALIVGANGARGKEGMGSFGRITKRSELPSKKIMIGYIKQAMKLNEAGVKSPTRSVKKVKAELPIPDELIAALKKSNKARTTFEGLSASHRREYIEWIVEAKREETRQRRVNTAVEWMEQGKPRNWKYM